MITIEKTEVVGWEAAVRGMRNPMNSWDKSDSIFNIEGYFADDGDRDCGYESEYGWDILGNNKDVGTCFELDDAFQNHVSIGDHLIGPNDKDLMLRLNKGGPVEAKYRRMIVVYADITAPLYWWKEFDTYKVGTVANSCSTMHKIHSKEFTIDDFSTEHLFDRNDVSLPGLDCAINPENDPVLAPIYPKGCFNEEGSRCWFTALGYMSMTCDILNHYRERFLETKDKKYWWQMIQLLPTSYNQKRTVMLNYEVLANIYPKRKNHKLDEWHDFCHWIEELPLAELIIGDSKS